MNIRLKTDLIVNKSSQKKPSSAQAILPGPVFWQANVLFLLIKIALNNHNFIITGLLIFGKQVKSSLLGRIKVGAKAAGFGSFGLSKEIKMSYPIVRSWPHRPVTFFLVKKVTKKDKPERTFSRTGHTPGPVFWQAPFFLAFIFEAVTINNMKAPAS